MKIPSPVADAKLHPGHAAVELVELTKNYGNGKPAVDGAAVIAACWARQVAAKAPRCA